MSENCRNCGGIGDACSCDKSVDVANEIAQPTDTALLDWVLENCEIEKYIKWQVNSTHWRGGDGNLIRTREDIRKAMEVGR